MLYALSCNSESDENAVGYKSVLHTQSFSFGSLQGVPDFLFTVSSGVDRCNGNCFSNAFRVYVHMGSDAEGSE